ncbi:MAG TPA: neutral/alkaline non-lysosomal ceramidase N-terminal domain-containing protein [Spirochaetia bacterium]|nr:neutral/alkaline non-lysosomal ceramidase N-terminal domain-containing protein [Spirochaetia bacterium]
MKSESLPIKIGLGQTVITPQSNIQMYGFARSQVSTGVHDDLYAKALVLESGNGGGTDGAVAVMLVLSLCGVGREYVEAIRAGIRKETGIPEGCILVSCTHTHAGPRVGDSNIQEVGTADREYPSFLTERAVESAVAAWNSRVPARIGVGKTEVPELGRNRRRLLYGGLHPDPEVGVIKIEDARGKLMGVVYNYGCHPSTLDWQNTLFSEDWVYYANEGIKKGTADGIWVAYFQGAEGDINTGYLSELSAVGVDMPIRNYGYIEIKGGQMSHAVLESLPRIETVDRIPLGVVSGTFGYPLRESFPVSLEQAERGVREAEERLADMERRTEYRGTRLLDNCRVDVWETGLRLRTAQKFYGAGDRAETAPIEHHAVRIGDGVFVSLPGEVFSEIGLRIKKASPFDKTFCIGIANGYNGYLPSEREFVEGGYEVDGCRYSPRTEAVCVESCLEMINRLTALPGLRRQSPKE